MDRARGGKGCREYLCHLHESKVPDRRVTLRASDDLWCNKRHDSVDGARGQGRSTEGAPALPEAPQEATGRAVLSHRSGS